VDRDITRPDLGVPLSPPGGGLPQDEGVNRRVLAWAGGGLALAEGVFTVAGLVALGFTAAAAVGSYSVTNTAIGGSLAAAGVVIALHRPRHPVGWIMLLGGLAHLTSAAAGVLGMAGRVHHWPVPALRLIDSVFNVAWPWGVCLALPLTLFLFPTGRPVSPRWRWVIWLIVAAGLLFVVYTATDNEPADGVSGLTSYLALPFYGRLGPLWAVANFMPLVGIVIAIVALVVRYRRGDEVLRRQLLWLVLASIVAIGLNLPRWITGYAPILLLLTIALVPAAVAVAILRYQLFDIRLVLARAVLYLLLTLGVSGAYLGGVAAVDALARWVNAPLVTALAIALAFNPVRVRLQRAVDRRLYGSRGDPVGAVSRVGASLATADLTGVLDATREALRLPYAALRLDGRDVATSGVAPADRHVVALPPDGELVVGVRRGEGRLGSADRDVLALLAAPLGTALRATTLAEQVQAARERLVGAREEERRRLHRDLHDGLGPTLTGAGFKADAAGNLVGTAPDQARALIAALRTDIGTAIADVRRVVYELRPPSLDELGLAGAIERYAEGLPMRVTVAAPELPALPAAVEVAAYRIATEALTNVARHAGARTVRVDLAVDTAVRLTVADDGTGAAPWRPGVGLSSMSDRVGELGGTCTAGPGDDGGGLVTAVLPLRPASAEVAP
jgi:two-component system, NarL family, sensor kinase